MQGLPIIVGMVEVVANRCLRLDPDAFGAAQTFAGQVIALNLRGIQDTVFLRFTPDGVHLTLSFDRAPDASVKATAGSLLRMLTSQDASKLTFDPEIVVGGDTDLVVGVKGVIDRIDVDWEEQLSHAVGDVAAHQLGNIFRRTDEWRQKTWGTVEQDVGEYLVEEGRLTPHKHEIIAFVDAIDILRDDTDRLEQRVRRLLDGKPVRPS